VLTRRGLIGSLISLAAAPAIVRASSLMPVKVMDADLLGVVEHYDISHIVPIHPSMYDDLVSVTRKAFVPRLFVQMQFASPALRYLQEHASGR
jgi:hypothetical protein